MHMWSGDALSLMRAMCGEMPPSVEWRWGLQAAGLWSGGREDACEIVSL